MTAGARLVSLILVQPVTVTANSASASAAAWRGFTGDQIQKSGVLPYRDRIPIAGASQGTHWQVPGCALPLAVCYITNTNRLSRSHLPRPAIT